LSFFGPFGNCLIANLLLVDVFIPNHTIAQPPLPNRSKILYPYGAL